MSPLFIVLLSMLGLATGFLAGLLGIGGGMLLVPFLTMLFTAEHFPPEHLIRMAIATSLTTILFTSVSSVRAHHRHHAVRWDIARAMAIGAFFGTLIGAQLASLVHARWLAVCFAAVTGYAGLRMLRNARGAKAPVTVPLPGAPALAATGGGIGFVASLIGAGGAFITVPFLRRANVSIREAVGTSAALGFPIAAGGLVGYAFAGWNVAGLPPHSIGFVDLPALLTCSIASVIAAPLGVRVGRTLKVASLEKIFATLLIGLALYMAWRAISA